MDEYAKWLAEQNGLAASSTMWGDIDISQYMDKDLTNNFNSAANSSMYNPTTATSNNTTLTNLGIDPKTFGQSYINNMQLGEDGKIYQTGFNDQVNQSIAEKGVMAGPTQQNADLIKSDGDWGYKEWGTAGNLGLGAGQLGLGLASYFDTAKTAKVQRNLLNQQYASNAEAIADRRANKEALSKIVIK